MNNYLKDFGMKIELTEGMAGKAIKVLGTAETAADAMVVIKNWKALDSTHKSYKVEPYNRFIFDKEHDVVIIDFGDYSTFIQVSDENGNVMKHFHGDTMEQTR